MERAVFEIKGLTPSYTESFWECEAEWKGKDCLQKKKKNKRTESEYQNQNAKVQPFQPP